MLLGDGTDALKLPKNADDFSESRRMVTFCGFVRLGKVWGVFKYIIGDSLQPTERQLRYA